MWWAFSPEHIHLAIHFTLFPYWEFVTLEQMLIAVCVTLNLYISLLICREWKLSWWNQDLRKYLMVNNNMFLTLLNSLYLTVYPVLLGVILEYVLFLHFSLKQIFNFWNDILLRFHWENNFEASICTFNCTDWKYFLKNSKNCLQFLFRS